MNYTKLWVIGACIAALAAGVVRASEVQERIKVRAVIEQLYLDILGREATTAEVDLWIGELKKGQTPEAIRKGMVESPEAEAAIHKVFKDSTGKKASEKELLLVRKELLDGKTLADLKAKLEKQKKKK